MAAPFLASEGDYVDRALGGFARANADVVALHTDPVFVQAVAPDPARVVGIVSGGGSGHEPMHAGLVGRGMLDAAVPGKVFASPHNRQVYQASNAVAGPEGVLHIVKNYTGDRINFGIAAERLRHDGIRVERVLIDDDIATDSADTTTGRRGTGATILVEKLLGAAADTGLGLSELAELGARIAARSRSIAVAAQAHTSPATGRLAFDLSDGEVEYGVGIHGERAARSVPRPPLEELVGRMLDDVLAGTPAGDRALLLVNGLGATTGIELHNVYAIAADAIAERGISLGGSLVGTWTPALDMKGFSLTVTMLQDDWQALWDAPVWTATLRK
ncbi:dihydroxyacetone kinase subunit DhaK [Dactylosporangium sp. NPDC005555]|uniref:dihydroxyacetone kinase subunit DhaK n=1 Tax=Dactylosporangium sp. NPDC005555 TaxID=3154889 RepID=UPI00339FF59F